MLSTIVFQEGLGSSCTALVASCVITKNVVCQWKQNVIIKCGLPLFPGGLVPPVLPRWHRVWWRGGAVWRHAQTTHELLLPQKEVPGGHDQDDLPLHAAGSPREWSSHGCEILLPLYALLWIEEPLLRWWYNLMCKVICFDNVKDSVVCSISKSSNLTWIL